MQNGHFALKIPSLAAHELLIVDVIDIDLRAPKLVTVNCPDAIAQQVAFQVNRKFGAAFNTFIAYLMIAGLFASIYLAVRLISGALQ